MPFGAKKNSKQANTTMNKTNLPSTKDTSYHMIQQFTERHAQHKFKRSRNTRCKQNLTTYTYIHSG